MTTEKDNRDMCRMCGQPNVYILHDDGDDVITLRKREDKYF